MGSGITFVVSYDCPHCGAALEGHTTRADDWLRCPSCGRASTPPGHSVAPATVEERPREPARPTPQLVSPPRRTHRFFFSKLGTLFSRYAEWRSEPRRPLPVAEVVASPVKVALAAALFVAIVFEVFAFLEARYLIGNYGALVVAVLLVFLTRPNARPTDDQPD